MMTAIVQEAPQTAVRNAIPPHVLIVGKKNAVDYIAPALFRLGSFGELVVRAKGSFSIVTAVNVAEMVKRDVEGLVSRPVIGTEEVVIDGITRRVSFIEIHLGKPAPEVLVAPVVEVEPVVEAPVVEAPAVQAPVIEAIIEEAAPAIAAPAEKLEQTAAKSKKIRAKAKTTRKKAPARKKKAE